jgi:hypothetical protein
MVIAIWVMSFLTAPSTAEDYATALIPQRFDSFIATIWRPRVMGPTSASSKIPMN